LPQQQITLLLVNCWAKQQQKTQLTLQALISQ
jgi:hypothetical protein